VAGVGAGDPDPHPVDLLGDRVDVCGHHQRQVAQPDTTQMRHGDAVARGALVVGARERHQAVLAAHDESVVEDLSGGAA
jgi:hypothetical protein